jgi:hypothetical protein
MKKFFIALTFLAALTFSVGPVLAAPGIPDDQPGTDFVCFFMVSQDRYNLGAGPTTYFNLSEVKGTSTTFDLDFYTTSSYWAYNTEESLTPWATEMIDINKYITEMSDGARTALSTTIGGVPYYAGYIYFDNRNDTADNIIGSVYLINLAEGLASAANIPIKEFYDGVAKTLISGATNYEKWTPDALAAANELIWGRDAAAATWFAIYPKYYILDSTGSTMFIFWTSDNDNQYHINIINGAEDYRSVTITINEVSFLDVGPLIPDALKVSYPYLGLFNITQPGTPAGGGEPAQPAAVQNKLEMLAWTWQKANSGAASAATNWDVLLTVARDVGTIGTAAPQP